jgi:dual specificity phosphatase 12
VLEDNHINHVLSITRSEDVPKLDEAKYKAKQIDIDDDPTEDILMHLNDACDWIDEALPRDSAKEDGTDEKGGVLVHCTQGISRSGAIVVAYCKKDSTRKQGSVPPPSNAHQACD